MVVTGAGRGIGREVALLGASEGASIVVNDPGVSVSGGGSDSGPAAEVVAAIEAAGGSALANTASVAQPDGAASIIDDAIEAFGRIDAVVNNAGILRDRIFHHMTLEEFEAVVSVHLLGSFYVARAAAPHFRKRESGAYVNFTSTSGLIGNYGQANYSAAKMGIVGLSNSIALDMQRFGVRSNCIAPFAWSRLTSTIPDEEESRVARMKQMTPESVAPLAVFLASDLASGVTGQVFGIRRNEVFLFCPMRPSRSVQRSDGWTPAAMAEHMEPALRSSFTSLQVSSDVISWDPV